MSVILLSPSLRSNHRMIEDGFITPKPIKFAFFRRDVHFNLLLRKIAGCVKIENYYESKSQRVALRSLIRYVIIHNVISSWRVPLN